MGTPNVDSALALSSVIVTLVYKHTDQRETFSGEIYPGGSHTFRYDDEVAGSVVYTRSDPKSFRRCAARRKFPILAPKLLSPGQFLINGSCCCVCGGLLIPKAANKVGAGARTYSRIPDDHENVPIPEAVPFKLFASIGVDLVSCRGNYGGAMIQTGSAATPTIVTTTVVHGSPAPRRNAEQIVTLQAPGTFYSGAAFLQWTSPEGDEYHITLSFPASVNPRPTIGDLTVVSDIPDVVITKRQTASASVSSVVGPAGTWASLP